MDITEIFEIYNIKELNDDGQVLITRCTTEYKGGEYDRKTDGFLNYRQEIIENNSIDGNKHNYVLRKNIESVELVEKRLEMIHSVLSKKGPDIKFERQVRYLDKIKSNLISWFVDNDHKYPSSIDSRPSFILAKGNGSATLNGKNYPLTKYQGAVIQVLYRAHLNRTPYMQTQEIFHQINENLSDDGNSNCPEGDKISDIFKSNREASAALIKRKGQSHYCLNLN